MTDKQRRRRQQRRDDGLRAIAVHTVRMYLEVACGRRAPRTLTGVATPLAAEQLRETGARARDTNQPGRIHRIAVRRPTRDHAEITALIHHTTPDDAGDRVAAVTIALQQAGRRWQIADIHELDRGHHYTHTPPDPGEGTPPDEHADVAFDVAMLTGGAAAADHRARTTDDPQHAAREQRLATEFRSRAQRLAADLPTTPDAAPAVAQPARPSRSAGRTHHIALLGPRPTDGDARTAWDDAAKLLDGYRTRWNITDPVNALGPIPPAGAQRNDRKHTLTRISALVRDLNTTRGGLTRTQAAKRPGVELDGP